MPTPTPTTDQRPVTSNALIKRIHRKLKRKRQYLERSLGIYYIHNDRDILVLDHVNIEALGRELGVLAVDERVTE